MHISKQSTGGDGRDIYSVKDKTKQNSTEATKLIALENVLLTILKIRIFALADDTGMCHGHSFFLTIPNCLFIFPSKKEGNGLLEEFIGNSECLFLGCGEG